MASERLQTKNERSVQPVPTSELLALLNRKTVTGEATIAGRRPSFDVFTALQELSAESAEGAPVKPEETPVAVR